MAGKKPKTQKRERVSPSLNASDQKRTPYTRYYQRERKEPEVEKPAGNAAADILSRLFNWLTTALIVFSAGYSLIVRQVSVGSVDKGSLHSKAEYSNSLASLTNSPSYHIKPLFNEKEATKKLQAKYPEITSVTFDIPWLGSRITADITTSRPVLRMTTPSTELVIDEQGRAITKSSDVNNSTVINLPKLEDQTGYEGESGQQVLSRQQVNFIISLLAQFKAKELVPSSLVLPAKAQELDVRITGQTYYIKFYMGGDPLVQFGAFFATKQRLDQQGPPPSEYIDARVEERIFVK